MELNERDIKKIFIIFLIISLAILVFLILKPVILSVLFGLILAYIFIPLHRRLLKIVKYKGLSAAIVSILVLLIIAIPLWFLIPVMVQQVFDFFQLSQNLDIQGFVSGIFPSASEQILAQITITLNSAITKLSSSTLNSLVNLILNFPVVALHFLLVAFVFFFTLKEEEKLREFTSGLAPLNKTQQRNLVNQFKDMTQAIIYGQIIIGLLQGILAGIGLLIFGIPNALSLTVLAVILSIIPVIGPSLIYLPVTIYLIILGNPFTAILFLIYNIFFVSSIESILRAHIISRKTKLSEGIALIGTIGGLFLFGVLGLILGPLILAYFVTFLNAHKDKRLSHLFAPDD